MAAPVIVNKRPESGDSDVGANTPLRFGLRDEDTRADLSTVYTSISYAQAYYLPAVLPSDDPVLNNEDQPAVLYGLSTFNDAAGAAVPVDQVDQSIQVVGPDTVYRLEQQLQGGENEQGFFYIHDQVTGDVPYMAEITLTTPVVTAGTTSYVTYTDFIGVMLGFVHWPSQKGLFLFFRDDTITKRITVAGPATDGIGTRSLEVTTVFDWTADTYRFRIVWDESPFRKTAMVLAEDSNGDETILADIDLSTVNTFLPTVTLERYSVANPPDAVTCVVGIDGFTAGDYIDIYESAVYRYGRPLLVGGVQTGGTGAEIGASTTVEFTGASDLTLWRTEGTGTIEAALDGTTLSITRESADAADTLTIFREETDLARQEWMLIANISGFDQVHEATFNTGMGIQVDDGTVAMQLRFLDDFFALDVGLYDTGDKGLTTSYDLPATQQDWTSNRQVFMLASSSKSFTRVYFGDDEAVEINRASYSGTAGSGTFLNVGFIDDDAGLEYFGTMQVVSLQLFPFAFFYEPIDATFPEAQAWTRTFLGGTRAIVGDRLQIDATTPGDYDIYSITDPDYAEESGCTVWFKAAVASWSDSDGSVSPPRSEIGPIATVTVGSQVVPVFFVLGDDGRTYVYLSGDDEDYLSVMARTTTGLRISEEIDFEQDHAYILVVRPRKHIQLYIDYASEPVIDIPWEDRELVLRLPPTNLPASQAAAFGSLGEDAGMELEAAFARASIGAGYDVSLTPNIPEPELSDHVYGSRASLFTDFEDAD